MKRVGIQDTSEFEEPLINKEKFKECNFLFTNITPLIELINRKSDQLENTDLQYFLEPNLKPQMAIDLVERIQMNELERRKRNNISLEREYQTPTFYIFKSLFLSKFIFIGLLNFLDKAIQIGSVYLLDLVTDAIKDYNIPGQDRYILKPILLLLSMTIVYTFGTYLESISNNYQNQFTTLLKIVGQYLIYQKALRTKYLQETVQKEKKDKKDGDEEYVANVNNLLTVDIEELSGIYWGVFGLSSSLVTIIIALYMLYLKLGNAVWTGLIVLGCVVIFNSFTTTLTIMFYRKALVQKDSRLALSSDVIEGMKQIKYLSWEQTFNDKILAIRKKEFGYIRWQKTIDIINNVQWSSISYILLYFFLSSYVDKNGEDALKSTNVFTIIALFNLLTFPLGVIPYSVNQLINTTVSYKRIKTYLDLKEINDEEIIRYKNCIGEEYVIEIPQIQFKWPSKENNSDDNEIFQLNLAELKIKKNTLNMIIGRIGCGKTALLNAILNEMEIKQQSQSSLKVKGSVAYVSQNHWLQNMSIRDNILFGKTYDKQLYKQCIAACDLMPDLLTFPKRDQYILGPDAKNISGGQKQRISLCRALYQNCDIYLMDDIFSSLDMHVADNVFNKGIKQMLLDQGKTILMITSQFRFIEMYNKCNIIYMIDGSVCQDEQLLNEFMSQEKEKQQKLEQEQLEKEEKEEKKLIHEKVKVKQSQEIDLDNPEDNLIEGAKKNEVEEEERESGEIAGDTVLYYLSQMGYALVILAILLSIVLMLSRNLIDFWIRSQISIDNHTFDFFDDWFGTSFNSKFSWLISIIVMITFVSGTIMKICILLSGWRTFKRLNQSIMNSKMIFFDNNAQGRIINRISNDTLVVDDELPWYVEVLIMSLLACIGYPIGIIILFPWLIVIIIIELFAFRWLQKYFRKSNRDLKRIQSTNEGKVISHLTETTGGLRTIRAFEKQQYFIKEYIVKLTESICSFVNSRRVSYWLSVRLHLLSNLIFLSVSITIILMMIFDIEIDYATSAMTLTYAVLIANEFNDTMNWFTQSEAKMVSVERIRQYFNNPQEQYNSVVKINPQVQQIIRQQVPPKPQNVDPNQYSIVFNDVTITYDDVLQSQNVKYALKNFSLFIKKGEKVAFVGRTGSGKTSILNILFRLYDFQQGQIYINGHDIQNMQLRDVRQLLSIVPQFGFLYNATLRDNIDPQGRLTDQQIEQAFNNTQFRIRGIMEDSTKTNNSNQEENQQSQTNINFMIAKSGGNLSNGEKQVINFMRVILQNKDIVCLDEATSNMDPKTDEELHKTLFDYVQNDNRTLLVITHRLENIQQYDRIVVLEKGEIVELGSYEELMQKNGWFVRLVNQNNE
ncbi:unnamed protein product [Paramecium primaurelia]|uniref:ABC transporter family protein n=1 Tax=Paramecium primaurelia TaxID=5886 RepID=A0A8S1JTZ2_PARPR|nr:unnamed protein product [Paramecium primaurelia]